MHQKITDKSYVMTCPFYAYRLNKVSPCLFLYVFKLRFTKFIGQLV